MSIMCVLHRDFIYLWNTYWSRLGAILGRPDAFFDVLEFCLIFGWSPEAVCNIRAALAKKAKCRPPPKRCLGVRQPRRPRGGAQREGHWGPKGVQRGPDGGSTGAQGAQGGGLKRPTEAQQKRARRPRRRGGRGSVHRHKTKQRATPQPVLILYLFSTYLVLILYLIL
jgi:hypothetical protein